MALDDVPLKKKTIGCCLFPFGVSVRAFASCVKRNFRELSGKVVCEMSSLSPFPVCTASLLGKIA